MSNSTGIEWTDRTWNPITGCTKVSPGCKYCYAETLSQRLRAMGANGYAKPFNSVQMLPERLDQPRRRQKSTTFFVNSMSDLFHESVTDASIERVLAVMRDTPQHIYQVLTKRAERLPGFFDTHDAPDNLWLGVSVEDTRYGIPRIAHLQHSKVAVRFLSCEPLIEHLGVLPLEGIHWVIVGGESGARARRMMPEWAHDIRLQCHKAGVAYFFKQWGSHGEDGVRRSKKSNGRYLGGRLYDSYPEPV